ncbi:Ku protein [Streptomyces sp. TRM64462]|uniref:non-homologous end joining protein Ku n=1 Tax=Streptomyces sp. TRM64462 TaxID=2741726 RepID=UPI001586AB04|nr:Ku protein [Streptomyces sp. TRM64462]
MARPIWTGVISFGLVTVPVGLYTATEDHTVHFHQLQRGTGDRIRHRRVNERTGKEVDSKDIVKGYDLGDGTYVVVEPEELDEIAPGKSQVIDIDGFVDLRDVEPVYFGRTYYVAPRGEEYAKVYEVLRAALERADKAGIATLTMRGKEYLTALRAQSDNLVLHTLHYQDEVRDPRKETDLPARHKPPRRELEMAEHLVEALAMKWDPAAYRDTYEDRVMELVEAKREGREVVAEEEPPEATNVVDLMDALRQSVDRAAASRRGGKDTGKGRGKGKSKSGGRGRAGVGARAGAGGDLAGLTKKELYERAAERGVSGRSAMSRDELVEALKAAG